MQHPEAPGPQRPFLTLCSQGLLLLYPQHPEEPQHRASARHNSCRRQARMKFRTSGCFGKPSRDWPEPSLPAATPAPPVPTASVLFPIRAKACCPWRWPRPAFPGLCSTPSALGRPAFLLGTPFGYPSTRDLVKTGTWHWARVSCWGDCEQGWVKLVGLGQGSGATLFLFWPQLPGGCHGAGEQQRAVYHLGKRCPVPAGVCSALGDRHLGPAVGLTRQGGVLVGAEEPCVSRSRERARAGQSSHASLARARPPPGRLSPNLAPQMPVLSRRSAPQCPVFRPPQRPTLSTAAPGPSEGPSGQQRGEGPAIEVSSLSGMTSRHPGPLRPWEADAVVSTQNPERESLSRTVGIWASA